MNILVLNAGSSSLKAALMESAGWYGDRSSSGLTGLVPRRAIILPDRTAKNAPNPFPGKAMPGR